MKNKYKNIIKDHRIWIIGFVFLFTFLLLAGQVRRKEVFTFDDQIYNFIHSWKGDGVTTFFQIITHLAGGYILVGVCICFLVFMKDRRYFFILSVNLGNTILFNVLLKALFARERPLGIALIQESGFSFPSGHSMIAMSFYGLLIYLIYHSNISDIWKKISISILSILIALIGISRIYLGVHYVSDVIAGFCLSIFYLVIFTRCIKKYMSKEYEMRKKGPLWKSFYYAICGIISAFHQERNLKIHVFIMLCVIVSGFLLKISQIEWLICIVLFGLVISLELVNTALETTIDLCMPDQNEKAKLAKDAAAGAVLVGAIASIIIGIIIFLPKVIPFIQK